MKTELKAPPGMFRVVGLNLRNNSDRKIKDCHSKNEAIELTDGHNVTREGLVVVYYAYDDKGVYHPGFVKINRDTSEKLALNKHKPFNSGRQESREANI